MQDGTEKALGDFSGRQVHAVAAIGNPDRFFDLLVDAGIDVTAHAHADHAEFNAEDLIFSDNLPILMTEKDAVKCTHLKADKLWFVVSELKFSSDDEQRLLRMLARVLEPGDAHQ